MKSLAWAAVLAALLGFARPGEAQTNTCTGTQFGALLHAATETTYTLSPTDQCHLLVFQNTAGDTITVPPPSAYFPQGWTVNILSIGAGTATLSTSLGGNINGLSSLALATGQGLSLFTDGSNWFANAGGGIASSGNNAVFGTNVGTLLWGSGSTITGKASGGATAATLAAVGLNGNLILGTPAGGTVFAGGSTAANAGLQVPTIASSVNQWVATSAATGTAPTLLAGGSGADGAEAAVFGTGGTGNISFDTAGTAVQFQVLHTGSAVNNLQVTGSTGTAVLPITATGTGATLPIGLFPKGASLVALGGTTVANSSAQVNTVASSVDFASISGSVAGAPGVVIYGTGGTDAQIDASLRPTGTTGKVRIADSYTNYITMIGSAAGNPQISVSGNNLILGTGSQLGQGATTGFILVPGNATGIPNGAPVGAGTGAIPMSIDVPDLKVCFYISAAWKCTAALS